MHFLCVFFQIQVTYCTQITCQHRVQMGPWRQFRMSFRGKKNWCNRKHNRPTGGTSCEETHCRMMRNLHFVSWRRSGCTFRRVCEVRAERDFTVCSQSRIIDAQPPQGNTGHQDELQGRGGRLTRFLTVCERVFVRTSVCVCEGY